ncbi:toxin-antitoxin system YwqK family antitoxin [Shewanella sp. Isolate7]|uniref:toxin-antitoxin system YwqK family antitoxin n=1 Tax=Shewanella sp. Isolate7 TaxID=2908528 RepID=UPI001EFCB4F6|nr:toxin-antitoxin system YwqK family antitoxin [Shewanella sp. Isolate7]MCG9719749.1 toxin-antitoxin system YwqK family antitoxin [Shewanella sp. Isolate7]
MMKPKRLLVGLGYQVASELTKDYVELDALEKVNGRFHLRDEAEPYSGKAKYFADEGWLKQQATLHQGKLNGELVSFYETGAIEVVEPYVDGQLEGVTRVYLEDGTLNKTIPYHNGLKERTEAHYGFEGGLLSKSIEYRQGKRNGWSTSYWDPDRLRNRIHYVDDLRDGLWQQYSFGKVVIEGPMVKDKEEGEWRSYFQDTDILKGIAHFKAGKLHGEVTEFYQNGAKECIEYYDSGNKVGTWTRFYDDNSPEQVKNYRDNQLDGSYREYHRGGKLAVEGQYQDGEKVGVWRRFGPDGRLISVGEEPKARLEADSAQNSVPRAQSTEPRAQSPEQGVRD